MADKLDIWCVKSHTIRPAVDAIEHETTYAPFDIEIENIKEHKEYYTTCPSCGRELHLAIFPGLNLSKAISLQVRRMRESYYSIGFPFLFSFPIFVMAIILIPSFRNFIFPGWVGWLQIIVFIYGFLGFGFWVYFLGESFDSMKLNCLIYEGFHWPSYNYPQHRINYHKKPITQYIDYEQGKELKDRIPYYISDK